MSQFNFDEFMKKEEQRQNNFEGAKITFLSTLLKNDGEAVYVRFPYRTAADFKFYSLHKISVNGTFRQVACLRSDADPVSNCPLCAKGDKPKDRFLIQCIVYIQGQNGIEIKPCVWDRPATFSKTLKERIDTFGQVVYKITRMGKANDKNTVYDVMPAPAQIYNEQAYPIDFSAFENYKFEGHMFLDKNYDEISQFLVTGSFPEVVKNNTQPQGQYQQPQVQPQQVVTPQPQMYQQPQQQMYQQPTFQQAEANPFNQPAQPQNAQGYNWQQPQQPQQPQPQVNTNRPIRKY